MNKYKKEGCVEPSLKEKDVLAFEETTKNNNIVIQCFREMWIGTSTTMYHINSPEFLRET